MAASAPRAAGVRRSLCSACGHAAAAAADTGAASAPSPTAVPSPSQQSASDDEDNCTNSQCGEPLGDDCVVTSSSRPLLRYCQRCGFSLLGREAGHTQSSQESVAAEQEDPVSEGSGEDDGVRVAQEGGGGGNSDVWRASQKRRRDPGPP